MLAKLLIIASLTLNGYISNSHGLIGIQVARDGGIIKVWKISPAHEAGLVKGDTVLYANGVKGIDEIDGDSGSVVHLLLKHKDGIVFSKDIVRVPREQIHD